MTIPARLSIVTLGVSDVARSVAFYETLGWERCASSMDEISWFRTADTYLGLFGWDDLAADANLVSPSRGSFGGITLAINVETPAAVDDALEGAIAAGGSLLKPGTELRFGYGGYFRRPRRASAGGLLQPRLPYRSGRADRDSVASSQAGLTTGRPTARAASASRSSYVTNAPRLSRSSSAVARWIASSARSSIGPTDAARSATR